MRGSLHHIAVALSLSASFAFASAQDMPTPPVLHEGLLKVSLTDFISGKYSLSYERVIGDWTSAEFTVTGIGLTMSDYTYTIAQPVTYPWDSFYPNLPADLEMEIAGWEVQGAVRKYGWVDDGVPDGFYASAFATVGGVSITADETFREVNFDPDTVFAASDLVEIDHTLSLKRWGFGLTIGYQWLMQSGLGLDAYLGPMFRGITKEFAMEGRSASEAEDIVGQRTQQRYWLGPGASEHYNGNTGPWFTGGLRISMAF